MLSQSRDELFKQLNQLEIKDRMLTENDTWNDRNHEQFTLDFLAEIRRKTFELDNSYEVSIEQLKLLRSKYAQIF
jgi:sugar diacid utilization regulator